MKTTVDLDDGVLSLAKSQAALRHMPLRALLEDALRVYLLPQVRGRHQRRHLEFPVVHGTTPPRVDVADRRTLYEFLDGNR